MAGVSPVAVEWAPSQVGHSKLADTRYQVSSSKSRGCFDDKVRSFMCGGWRRDGWPLGMGQRGRRKEEVERRKEEGKVRKLTQDGRHWPKAAKRERGLARAHACVTWTSRKETSAPFSFVEFRGSTVQSTGLRHPRRTGCILDRHRGWTSWTGLGAVFKYMVCVGGRLPRGHRLTCTYVYRSIG